MAHKHAPFTNPAAVASYAENARRSVPGLGDLHRMVMLLLAEHVQDGAHILIVGAGGGMETSALAGAQPTWRFTGVDPSPAMLNFARDMVSAHADRVKLIEGTVDQVPESAFDGATCLLTFHHLDRNERLQILRDIRVRLKRDAPLVIVEHTAPGSDPRRWMTLAAAYRDREGPDWAQACATGTTMIERLPLLTPAEEEDLLHEGGFAKVELFYAALSFRGWVAHAA